MDLITRSDDERLRYVLIYPKDGGLKKAIMDATMFRDSLVAALAQLAEKERQLCMAREAWEKARLHTSTIDKKTINWINKEIIIPDIYARNIDAALTSSSPCPHAKEAERLRKLADDAIAFAMEGWAYAGEHFKAKWNYEGELAELRRHAGGEG